MKLVSAQVTNYRNILDSGVVEIAPITCLVGKNEAGKTAFLKALEGLRSTDASYEEYGKIEDYPRRYLADYAKRHPAEDAPVVSTNWEMSDADLAILEAEFGEDAVSGKAVSISKRYGKKNQTWSVPVDSVRCCFI